MALLLHIVVALASIAASALLLLQPSRTKLHTSYGLVALTLLSGTYVAWAAHTHIMQACLSGLLYLGFVTSLIFMAQRKLAKETVVIQRKIK